MHVYTYTRFLPGIVVSEVVVLQQQLLSRYLFALIVAVSAEISSHNINLEVLKHFQLVEDYHRLS